MFIILTRILLIFVRAQKEFQTKTFREKVILKNGCLTVGVHLKLPSIFGSFL